MLLLSATVAAALQPPPEPVDPRFERLLAAAGPGIAACAEDRDGVGVGLTVSAHEGALVVRGNPSGEAVRACVEAAIREVWTGELALAEGHEMYEMDWERPVLPPPGTFVPAWEAAARAVLSDTPVPALDGLPADLVQRGACLEWADHPILYGATFMGVIVWLEAGFEEAPGDRYVRGDATLVLDTRWDGERERRTLCMEGPFRAATSRVAVERFASLGSSASLRAEWLLTADGELASDVHGCVLPATDEAQWQLYTAEVRRDLRALAGAGSGAVGAADTPRHVVVELAGWRVASLTATPTKRRALPARRSAVHRACAGSTACLRDVLPWPVDRERDAALVACVGGAEATFVAVWAADGTLSGVEGRYDDATRACLARVLGARVLPPAEGGACRIRRSVEAPAPPPDIPEVPWTAAAAGRPHRGALKPPPVHPITVSAVAVHGRWLASVGREGPALLRDVDAGTVDRVPVEEPQGVAVSADTLAVLSKRRVEVYDLPALTPRWSHAQYDGRFVSIAPSGDVLVRHRDRGVLLAADTGAPRWTISLKGAVAWSADGSRFVSGLPDYRLHDTSDGAWSVAWLEAARVVGWDGDDVAFGVWDRPTRFFATDGRRLDRTGPDGVAALHEGLAVVEQGDTARLVRLADGDSLAAFPRVRHYAFGGGSFAAVGIIDGVVRGIDGTVRTAVPLGARRNREVVADGDTLWVSGHGEQHRWDWHTGALQAWRRTMPVVRGAAVGLRLEQDRDHVLLYDGDVLRWAAEVPGVREAALSPAGVVAAIGRDGVGLHAADGTRTLIDASTGTALAWAPDGRLAVGTTDGTVRVFRGNGEPAGQHVGHGASVQALAWTGDALVSVDREGDGIAWADGRITARMALGEVSALAGLGRGRFATAAWEGPVHLWTTGADAPDTALDVDHVSGLVGLPRGRLLVAADTLQVWHGDTLERTLVTLPDGAWASGAGTRWLRADDGHLGTDTGATFTRDR